MSLDRPSSPSVLRMAAPLVVSFWMRAAFTLVDTVYAAIIGDAAVAAIGLTVPFEFLMIALWVGLSTGLTSSLSRAMGARQGRQIEQYLKTTLRLILVVAPAFSLVGVGIAVFGGSLPLAADVRSSFRIYGSTLIGAGALTSFWSILPDSVVKAHQDTRSTMWAGILSNGLNLGLNTFFVFVLHWGVFGIALSTVLGRIAGLVYASMRARRHETARLAEGRDTGEDRDPRPYRTILALAVPVSLTFALMAAETAVVNSLLAGMEHATEAIAAFSIYHRVVLFAINPVIAGSVALLPYTARRFGERDVEGIKRGLREALLGTVAYAVGILAPVLLPLAPTLAAWLTESPLTTRYTVFALRLVPLACALGAPFLLCRPVFEGMHQGRPGLVIAVLRYVVLTPPAAWLGVLCSRYLDLPSLYGLVVGLLVVSAISSALFYAWLRAVLPREA